jgi:hypothetical protein
VPRPFFRAQGNTGRGSRQAPSGQRAHIAKGCEEASNEGFADIPSKIRPTRGFAGGEASRLAGRATGRLFASHLDLVGAENPRSRDLGRDQECRNDGRHAYQSEKLIHRKHLLSPQDDFKSRTQTAFNA